MSPHPWTMGHVWKLLRERTGLSQIDLERKANVRRGRVTRFECNKGVPDLTELQALAKCFEMTTAKLVRSLEKPSQYTPEQVAELKAALKANASEAKAMMAEWRATR